MQTRKPSYWRAFWATAALVGAVNVAFSVYFACIPEAPIGKGGRMAKPVPDWAAGAMSAINIPGGLLALPVMIAARDSGQGEAGWPALFAVMLLSTLFWGGVGVGIEWFRYRRQPTGAGPMRTAAG